MDFGETLYFLLHFTEIDIENYLDSHFGAFQMYWTYETRQDLAMRTLSFMDTILRHDDELIEVCAITGERGLCRPITLCN